MEHTYRLSEQTCERTYGMSQHAYVVRRRRSSGRRRGARGRRDRNLRESGADLRGGVGHARVDFDTEVSDLLSMIFTGLVLAHELLELAHRAENRRRTLKEISEEASHRTDTPTGTHFLDPLQQRQHRLAFGVRGSM